MPLTAVATRSRSGTAVRSLENARETEEAATFMIPGCYVQPNGIVSMCNAEGFLILTPKALPGHGGEAGGGGDGVEAEFAVGELQSEVFGLRRTQVAASRFVDDLARALLRDALADDHEPQRTRSFTSPRR